jgi:hypothetical protein
VKGDINLAAVAREVFIDGVVQDFEHAMVEPALVCGPDVHPWPLAYAGKALQFVNF